MSEGTPHSQILEDQKQLDGGGLLGGPLRFPLDQLAILWVQCDQSVLDQRCDKRVNSMIQEGLLSELKAFHKVRVITTSLARVFWSFHKHV
jgi:tRNA dimethylallyltransferase